MIKEKLFLFEKILFFVVLAAATWGYWYFEESTLLRILVVGLGVMALITAFGKKDQKSRFSSRYELASLLVLYLGIYALYNFLYSVNLPLYFVMASIFALVTSMLFSLLSLDKLEEKLGKKIFHIFIVLMGLVSLEIFLALYFWPIDPQLKALIIVAIFNLILSLIYLYVHGMLRLKRIIGYLIVTLIILGSVLMFISLRIGK